MVNRNVSEVVGPRRLPKLELADGVPEELRTLVAVPTMMSSNPSLFTSPTAMVAGMVVAG